MVHDQTVTFRLLIVSIKSGVCLINWDNVGQSGPFQLEEQNLKQSINL